MRIPEDDVIWVPPVPAVWRRPPPGRVLCLAPHPDDESIGPGGTLALHRRQDDPVRVVVATDGIAGDPDRRFPADAYPEMRRRESRAGLRHLGVADVGFWGLPDSCVISDRDLDMLAGRVQEEIDRFRPDILYCCWEGEGNSDHRALYSAVIRTLKRQRFVGPVLGYEIWNLMVPDVIVDVSPVIEQKELAIRSYATQFAYTDILRPTLGLNASRSMIFNNGHGYGEALRRIVPP